MWRSRIAKSFAIPAIVGVSAVSLHLGLVGMPCLRAVRHRLVSFPMPDDAYYYLQPAWNVVHEGGITMDGVSPTNGFHPLWMLIMSTLAASSPTKAVLLSRAQALSLVVFYLSATMFALCVGRLFSRRFLSLVALVLYLLIPQLLGQHMNGLETGILLLLTSSSLLVLVSSLGRSGAPRNAATLLLGSCTALLFLARTDTVFAVVAIYGASLYTVIGGCSAWSRSAKSMRGLLLSHLWAFWMPHAMLAGPWFLWNLKRFGSVVQASAFILPSIARRYYTVYHDYDQAIWDRILPPGLWHNFTVTVSEFTVGIPLGAFVLIVVGSLLAVRMSKERGAAKPYQIVLAVLTSSFLTLGLVHTCVRLSPRPWYFVHAQLLLILAVSGILFALWSNLRAWRTAAVLVFLLFATALQCGNRDYYQQLIHHKEASFADLARREYTLYAPVPEDVRVVGHTDGGRFTFFAPEHLTVTNLDGLINNAAASAVLEGELMRYILASPQEFVILRPKVVHRAFVMGHGFRRHLESACMWGGYLHARVIRSQERVMENISLPADGVIDPTRMEHWPYLLGEWRFAPGAAPESRMGVQNCGVQFSTSASGSCEFRVVMASPYGGVPQTCDLLLDGNRVGSISYDGVRPESYQAALGSLSPGIHEIVMANRERLSPRLLGRNDDSRIGTYIVYRFELITRDS